MAWALDLVTDWAKVELMTTTALTVTWEGFLNVHVALLAPVGEFYYLLPSLRYCFLSSTKFIHIQNGGVYFIT